MRITSLDPIRWFVPGLTGGGPAHRFASVRTNLGSPRGGRGLISRSRMVGHRAHNHPASACTEFEDAQLLCHRQEHEAEGKMVDLVMFRLEADVVSIGVRAAAA